MAALTARSLKTRWPASESRPTHRHCQVDEKLVDRPPRYWAPARREPAMLGIKTAVSFNLTVSMIPLPVGVAQ